MMNKKSKPIAVLICAVVYLISAAIAWFSLPYFHSHFNLLITTLLADVVATTVVFLFSTWLRNASMYDPYWSVAPPLIVWYWITQLQSEVSLVCCFIFGAVLLWSVRLTLNWVRGWQGMQHEDWRYIQLRNENPKLYPLINFGGIHLFPTLMVFACLLPLYYAFHEHLQSFNNMIFCGLFICIGATVLSFVADEQMRVFRKTGSANDCMNTGLWKYSRHPNYLGEILFWFGVWIIAIGVNLNLYWTIAGLILLKLMFIFISIPMMEKRNLTRRKNYADVIKKVPMLIGWPM